MITNSLRESLMFKALSGAYRDRQIASYILLGALRPQMTFEELEDLLAAIRRKEGAGIAAEARSLIREWALTAEAV